MTPRRDPNFIFWRGFAAIVPITLLDLISWSAWKLYRLTDRASDMLVNWSYRSTVSEDK